MKELSILGLALVFSLLTAGVAHATATAGAPPGPLGVVKASLSRVQGIVQSSPTGSDEWRAGIVRVSHELFDFNEISRRALGPHWKGVSPVEQDEFVQLFTAVLDRAFIASVSGYTTENIAFLGQEIDGAWPPVRSRIVPSKGAAISIDYRLHEANLRWTVYDVVWERVSLVANYRSQFNAIIRASSFAQLLVRMRTDQQRRLDAGAQTPFASDRLPERLLLSVITKHAHAPR